MKRRAWLSLLLVGLAACGAEVKRSNPYDPALPPDQQVKASLSGVVRRTGATTTPEPLLGASVSLAGPTIPESSPATTGADGVYRFNNLIPGLYSLEISHPASITYGRDLLLAPGDERQQDVVLIPLPSTGSPDAGHLTGVVELGAQAGLLPAEQDHSGILVEVEGTGLRTVTNGAGRFDIYIAAGTYNVLFSAPDHNPARRDGIVAAEGATTEVDTSPIVLSVNPGSVTGVVRLLDANNAPLAADLHGGVSIGTFGYPAASSAANGSFLLGGLPAGSYTLTATLDGYASAVVPGVVVRGGRATSLTEPIVLEVARGGLTGVVSLSGQSDSSGVMVRLAGTSFVTLTDAGGAYALSGVPVGIYTLAASKDGYYDASISSLAVTSGSLTPVTPLTLARKSGLFELHSTAPGSDPAFTRVPLVELRLVAPPGTTQLEVTGDLDASESLTWRSYDPAGADLACPAPQAGVVCVLLDAAADGQKSVTVRFADALAQASAPVSASIVVDTTPPEVAAIVIDGDAQYSKDASLPTPRITLTFAASDATSGVDALQLSEASSFTASAPAPRAYVTSLLYALAVNPIDGQDVFVYARYRDRAGNFSSVVNDRIVFDRVAPLVSSVSIDCGGVVDATHCDSPIVELSLATSDPGSGASGVTLVALSNTLGFPVTLWQPQASTAAWLLSPGDGTKRVYVKVQDAAGNVSLTPAEDPDGIILDTQAPNAGSLVLNGGDPFTNSPTVSFELTSDESGAWDAILSGDIVETGLHTSSGLPTYVTLLGNPGTKWVSAVVLDAAGNTSLVTSASVTFDDVPPADGVVTVADGRATVNTRNITVTIANTNPDYMKVWEEPAAACPSPACGDPGFVDFSPFSTLTLSPALGAKRVCWRLCDAAGNASTTGTSTLTLGTYIQRPTPQLTGLSPINQLALSAEGAPEPNYTVTLSGRGIASDTLAEIGDFLLPCSGAGATACVPDTLGGCGAGGACEASCAESCVVDLPDAIMRNVGTYVVRLTTPQPVEGAGTSSQALFFGIIAPQPQLVAVSPRGILQAAGETQSVTLEVWGKDFMDNVEFRLGANYGLLTSFAPEPSLGPTGRYLQVEITTAGLVGDDLVDMALVAINPSPGGGEASMPFGVNPDPATCAATPCFSNMRPTRAPQGRSIVQPYAFAAAPATALAWQGGDALRILDAASSVVARVEAGSVGAIAPLPWGFDHVMLEASAAAVGSSVILAPASRRGDGTFLPYMWNPPPPSGTLLRAHAFVDLDRDGRLEIIVADETANGVRVYFQSQNGFDEGQLFYDMAAAPYRVLVTDLDGDGLPDVVTPSGAAQALSIRHSRSDGTLGPRTDIAAQIGQQYSNTSLRAGDVDGDMDVDLVFYNGGQNVITLRNTGRGQFSPPIASDLEPTNGLAPAFFELADATTDGILDVIGNTDYFTRTGFRVFPGFGDGRFAEADSGLDVVNMPPKPGRIFAMGDLNLDGVLDVAFLTDDLDPAPGVSRIYLAVALGGGDGSFDANVGGSESFISFSSADGVSRQDSVRLAELTGDGYLDALIYDFWGGKAVVFPGTGDGRFTVTNVVDGNYGSLASLPAAATGTSVADLVDLDLDGALDAVVTSVTDGVRAYRGQGTWGLPSALPIAAGGVIDMQALDFDRDGNLDLMVPQENDGRVAFGMGTGNFFNNPTLLPSGNMKAFAAVLDADGDGFADPIQNSNYGTTRQIYLYRNNRDRTFTAFNHQTQAGGFDGYSLYLDAAAVGDFNQDGRADLIAAERQSTPSKVRFYLWRNNGAGRYFGSCDGAGVCSSDMTLDNVGSEEVLAVDLDNNGLPDVVTGNTLGQPRVYLGTGVTGGLPTFAAAQTFLSPSGGHRDTLVADINNDGRFDIIEVHASDLQYLLNTTAGTTFGMSAPVTLTVGSELAAAYPTDLNGDGNVDLVLSGGAEGVYYQLMGHGDGTFAEAERRNVGPVTGAIIAADFFADGQRHVAVGSNSDDATWVYRSPPPAPWPQRLVWNAMQSTPLPAGSTVTGDLSQTGQFIDKLAVSVRILGTGKEGLSLSVRAPDGREVLLDAPGCGGDWSAGAPLVATYPTTAACGTLSALHGWQPPGLWQLVVTNDGSANATVESFAVATRGSFQEPIGRGRRTSPERLLFQAGDRGKTVHGTTLGRADEASLTCALTQGDASGDAVNDAGDAWYELTLPATRTVAFAVVGSFDAVLELRSGTCASSGAALSCNNNGLAGKNPILSGVTLTAGSTYCLVVDGAFDTAPTPDVAHAGAYDLFVTLSAPL